MEKSKILFISDVSENPEQKPLTEIDRFWKNNEESVFKEYDPEKTPDGFWNRLEGLYKEGLIRNKLDGLEREKLVEQELHEHYPDANILSEVYLRDENGNIVKDSETNEARRIDFVVVRDGKVVDSIEVTSQTADKTEQSAKEERIRNNGGTYIKDSDGRLIKIPDSVKTRIERRD